MPFASRCRLQKRVAGAGSLQQLQVQAEVRDALRRHARAHGVEARMLRHQLRRLIAQAAQRAVLAVVLRLERQVRLAARGVQTREAGREGVAGRSGACAI